MLDDADKVRTKRTCDTCGLSQANIVQVETLLSWENGCQQARDTRVRQLCRDCRRRLRERLVAAMQKQKITPANVSNIPNETENEHG